jgi:hypothetical protein
MFFQSIYQMITAGTDLNINIRKVDNSLSVAVIPRRNSLKEDTRQNMVPLVVNAPRKGVTLVTPFFVVYQTIKALEVDGEHIKIGCIFTGNLPVFPDFYRYFHL